MSAEVQESNSGKDNGKRKQKKVDVRVDFTPMVDMNMLLITFFMLCTSFIKPQTMEITMPTNDKNIQDEDKNEVKASEAITFILDKDDVVYYFTGLPQYDNPASLKTSSYGRAGIRQILLERNREAVLKALELKQKYDNLKMTKQEYTKELAKIKSGKGTPVVIIKATDGATYANLVDALDEMQICSVGKYVISPITDQDLKLLKERAAMK